MLLLLLLLLLLLTDTITAQALTGKAKDVEKRLLALGEGLEIPPQDFSGGSSASAAADEKAGSRYDTWYAC